MTGRYGHLEELQRADKARHHDEELKEKQRVHQKRMKKYRRDIQGMDLQVHTDLFASIGTL